MVQSLKKVMVIVGVFLILGVHDGQAQQNDISKKEQIEAAVSPAPEGMQKNATVMGYNGNGEVVTLREGSNKLICISDDPRQDNFHVACYHKDLEPFMERGRELKKKGLPRQKVDSIRYKEIEKGDLDLPKKPMALYSLTGSKDSFDYTSGMVKNAKPLYVVYIPFATEESTGLSKKPVSKGAPWIMEPGTPWAHIMVMTGRNIGGNGDMKKESEQ